MTILRPLVGKEPRERSGAVRRWPRLQGGNSMAHQTRPFVGINADYVPASKVNTPFMRLNAGYLDNVVAAGGLPVVVPPLGKEIDLEAWLDRLDGFILTGSPLDLDPRRLGMPPHSSVQPLPERREDDRLLVRRILERRLPVLAIGLGMQQLNVACGGSLYVHLPQDMPRAMPHRDPTGAPHRHIVLIEPNTRMEEIYGAGEIRVDSAHHQAVRQVGADLRIGARRRRTESLRRLKARIPPGSAWACNGTPNRRRPRPWICNCSSISSRHVCVRPSRCN